jgi:hypothetical protein
VISTVARVDDTVLSDVDISKEEEVSSRAAVVVELLLFVVVSVLSEPSTMVVLLSHMSSLMVVTVSAHLETISYDKCTVNVDGKQH